MFIRGTSGISSHPKLHTYEEGYLLPVLTGDQLLFSQRHKGLLRQLRDLAECDTDDFDATYGALLAQFMEFSQVLPHKANGILGSLINYSLARASAALQKYCQLYKNQTTPLYKFAVLSAALLKDVGCVISNQRVALVTENGDFIRDWNPFQGAMVGQSEFFKMYQLPVSYLRIEKESTLLLARQLIPRDAFLWLSNDLTVFADWIAALLGEEGPPSKEISHILAMIKRDDILAILSGLDGANIDPRLSVVTEYGEAFYQWLKEAIDKDALPINTPEAAIHITPEGVLIEQKLFKQFAESGKFPVNFITIFQQFGNLMGIVSKSGSDFIHRLYFSPNASGAGGYGKFAGAAAQTRSTHEGMVVSQDAVFIKRAAPELSSLKSTQSATLAQHQFQKKIITVKNQLNQK